MRKSKRLCRNMCRRMGVGAYQDRSGIVQDGSTANGIIPSRFPKRGRMAEFAGAVKFHMDHAATLTSEDGLFYLADSSFCHSDEMKAMTYMDFVSGAVTNRIELKRIDL